MADEDFNVETLAEYLHLNPEQVAKLAERGKLPCRRVAGRWRFSRADIAHWLEERIGLSDDAELLQMEGFLRKPSAEDCETHPRLIEMLPLEAIEIPLGARTRTSVISGMTEVAARTGWLWDPQLMATAVRDREDMSSTALDNGLALLHPRRPQAKILGQAFLAFGRTARGIPFGGARGSLTDLFWLICSLDDRGHLRTLARLSRILAQPDIPDQLRAAPDAYTVRELIATAEKQLD